MFVLGAALTLAIAYSLGAIFFGRFPIVIRLALGAAIESFLVYLLFILGLGHYLPVLAVFVPAIFFIRPKSPEQSPTQSWIFFPIFLVFAVYYLVHAMAPEIQPDAISYHLGLTAEYLRLGAFPHRVGFYEILPQGLEMLFAVAFSVGGASAAKLVHFAFLLATLPLILLIARRLQLSDPQGYAAAALYFVAPVVGISGTCAYNDAALVFFTLTAFYLLLRDAPACAGIAAGFCYDIKLTGLLVPVLAVVFIIWTKRQIRPSLRLSASALVMLAPWMLRALILTRNPVAPLFNSLFPNLYFNPVFERTLAHALANYPGFHWQTGLWTWAITGAAHGVIGPLILFVPFALLGWRKPNVRLLLAAAFLLCIPVVFNVGARFLMPSLPFFALALVAALPRPAILALTFLQAIVCLPPAIARLEQPNVWALRGFPWRAALRLQPEDEYLNASTGDYAAAHFIETHTGPQDRIFALKGIATLFTTREVLEFWHSNRAQRYTAALQAAHTRVLTVKTRAEWQPIVLSAIRFVSTADVPLEWSVFDVRLYSPGGFVYNSPQWNLNASPNPSDSLAAFDGNPATFWTTRVPQRRGMYLEAEFTHPQLLNAATFIIAANAPQPGFAVEGRPVNGRGWQLLSDRFQGKVMGPRDRRSEAVFALYRAGFTHIVVPETDSGLGIIGVDMIQHPEQWRLTDLGGSDDFHLMKILKP